MPGESESFDVLDFSSFFSIFLFVHLELRDQRDGLREPFDVPFYVLLCLFWFWFLGACPQRRLGSLYI